MYAAVQTFTLGCNRLGHLVLASKYLYRTSWVTLANLGGL